MYWEWVGMGTGGIRWGGWIQRIVGETTELGFILRTSLGWCRNLVQQKLRRLLTIGVMTLIHPSLQPDNVSSVGIRTPTQTQNLLRTVCSDYKVYLNKGGKRLVGVTSKWPPQIETHATGWSPYLTLSRNSITNFWIAQSPKIKTNMTSQKKVNAMIPNDMVLCL